MADNIVQGLFGPSPYEIEQAQNAGLFKSADQYAAQSPFERAAGQMYRAGGMFGGAGAEAMGMVNPRVVEAQQADAIMRQVDTSTAEGLTKGAMIANQMGNPKLSYLLATAAQKKRAEEQDIALKAAHAKYYEQGGASGKKTLENIMALSDKEMASKLMVTFNTAQLASQNMNFPSEELRAAWVDAQVNRAHAVYLSANPNAGKISSPVIPSKQPTQPQAQVQPKAEGGFPSVSNEEQAKRNIERIAVLEEELKVDPTNEALNKELSNAKAAQATGKPFGEFKLNNSVPTMAQSVEAKARAKAKGEKDPAIAAAEAAAKEGGKGVTEFNLKQHEKVRTAQMSMPKIDALINQLEKGDVTTGLAAEFRVATNKALALLGGREGARRATDSEIANVMMGSEVFPLIQSLGVGARGMDTPAERDFMRQVLTGTLTLEKNTLKQMAQFRKDALQREIDQWNDRIDKGELDSYFKNTGQTKEKVGIQKSKSKDQEALDWANANPSDPRAAKIKSKLGVK